MVGDPETAQPLSPCEAEPVRLRYCERGYSLGIIVIFVIVLALVGPVAWLFASIFLVVYGDAIFGLIRSSPSPQQWHDLPYILLGLFACILLLLIAALLARKALLKRMGYLEIGTRQIVLRTGSKVESWPYTICSAFTFREVPWLPLLSRVEWLSEAGSMAGRRFWFVRACDVRLSRNELRTVCDQLNVLRTTVIASRET
jgi:hypothetical protein